MYQKYHCIALRTVRYNDRSSFLSVWSAEAGRISLAIPAGNGREARRRRALTMPLSLFEAQVDLRPDRQIHTPREISPATPPVSFAGHPVKGAVAVMLAEILDHILRQQHPDATLTAFIAESLRQFSALDNPMAIANYHIYFLVQLSYALGIGPDLSGDGQYFDMQGGRYTRTIPLHPRVLGNEAAAMPRILVRLRPRHLPHIRWTRRQRNDILDGILQYYTLHLTNLSDISSLPILRQLL